MMAGLGWNTWGLDKGVSGFGRSVKRKIIILPLGGSESQLRGGLRMPGKPRDAIQQQGVAFCALPGLEARPSQREGDVAAASLSNVSAFNNTSPTRGASDSIDKSVSTDNSLAHDSGQHQFSPNQFHNGVKMMLRVLLMVCVGIMLSQCAIAQKKDRKSDKSDNPKLNRPDIHKLRPQFPTDQLITKSEQAIQDGFNFLVKTQNKDLSLIHI